VLAVALGILTLLATARSRGAHAGRAVSITAKTGTGGHVGQRLSAFRLRSIDGHRISAPDGPAGVVFFMASWCTSCTVEARALADVQRRLGHRVAALAISPDPSDSVAALRRFRAAAGGVAYPFAWESTGALVHHLDVRALDTTLVCDRTGRIVYRDAIPTQTRELLRALARAGVAIPPGSERGTSVRTPPGCPSCGSYTP
jgi:peroxiredoxin